uniref:Uncharacterized protein n=1 Tax=Glossina palpalis gambiensis TaxID=67801 RepID=A0A1B0ATC5_9MUSC
MKKNIYKKNLAIANRISFNCARFVCFYRSISCNLASIGSPLGMRDSPKRPAIDVPGGSCSSSAKRNNEPKRSTFSLKLAEESSSFSVEDGFSTSDFNKHVSFIDLGTFVKDSNCLVKLPVFSIFFALSSRSTSIFGTLVASTCCSTSSPGLAMS